MNRSDKINQGTRFQTVLITRRFFPPCVSAAKWIRALNPMPHVTDKGSELRKRCLKGIKLPQMCHQGKLAQDETKAGLRARKTRPDSDSASWQGDDSRSRLQFSVPQRPRERSNNAERQRVRKRRLARKERRNMDNLQQKKQRYMGSRCLESSGALGGGLSWL